MNVISHVSVGTTPEKFSDMLECYDKFMLELGAKRQMAVLTDGVHVENPAAVSDTTNLAGMAYGKYFPEFWIQLPNDKESSASAGNGVHVAFTCKSAAQVQKVYQAAIENKAVDNGKPGPRPEYSDKYYGAFFKDPMGNKLEAVFFDMGFFMNNCTIL